jgi:hypothetical protein
VSAAIICLNGCRPSKFESPCRALLHSADCEGLWVPGLCPSETGYASVLMGGGGGGVKSTQNSITTGSLILLLCGIHGEQTLRYTQKSTSHSSHTVLPARAPQTWRSTVTTSVCRCYSPAFQRCLKYSLVCLADLYSVFQKHLPLSVTNTRPVS